MGQEMNKDNVKQLLYYDPETGIFTWRTRHEHWFTSARQHKTWNTRYAGKQAGNLHTNMGTKYTYVNLNILGKRYLAHRIAWLYMSDEAIPEQIDHKNRDATDNRWENLRASTGLKNSRNSSKSISNKSGVTGVIWTKGAWQAQGKVGGKYKYLGRFKEIDEAAMAAMEFRAENDFDPHHGLEIANYNRESAHV